MTFQRAFRFELAQLALNAVSSTTNDVCSEESSVPVKLTLVVPAGTVKLFSA